MEIKKIHVHCLNRENDIHLVLYKGRVKRKSAYDHAQTVPIQIIL